MSLIWTHSPIFVHSAHVVPAAPRNAGDLVLELVTLPAPDVPPTVREMVTNRLMWWGVARESVGELSLAAVELVTNACRETPLARVGFRAVLAPRAREITIAAWDGSPEMPKMDDSALTLEEIDALPDDHEFGGWGLRLVAGSAARVGTRSTEGGGKWVYAIYRPKFT
ncbi:ATP-binding protein [Actinocorallia sp. API 0066]|uniref:ATP-binding protein n=1 Tax=Actinocorallia sp. API 0066 TaxID=2896846 RepID=UPI001E3EA031|nr:ATP-binding protein [Actinocorallia sp. API 0066]MCD0449583.1 ATP-binding protein [Actinocorallia sp. API 0066]